MASHSDPFLLYGTLNPEPPVEVLTAGPFRATFQDGNLRTVTYLGHEVLRAISFLVRDKDWGTCKAEISDLHIAENSSGFQVRYRAHYAAPSGAHLDCDIAINGDDQSLTFEADCVSDSDFETARAGFTVLHPLAGLAGEAIAVEHGDGSVEQSRWPGRIEPWQPFMDIRAITHTVASGVEAETRFEGDTFEMEDQRNWTDGSYKTYVRPLALPWPYLLKAGETFTQGVSVAIRATDKAEAVAASGGAVTLSLAATDIILPEIGVGLRPECRIDELACLDVLKSLSARHLVAHFDPVAGHGVEALKGYAKIERQSGLAVTLEFAVPCRRPLEIEFADLAAAVHEAGLALGTLFVSPSVDRQSTPPGSAWPECPPLEAVYAAARQAFPGVRLGGGMLSYFTELNRKRVPGELIDYVSHCTNPIVHAADDLSVMQTFEALDHVVRSVRAIYGDKPYRIGPSTIAMRQNPYGSRTKDNPHRERIPMANVDPRHNAQFGAAWTLAYAAIVAAAAPEVLTLSTLAGPFGLVAGTDEPVAPGGLRPLAHVLAALGSLSGKRLLHVATSRPAAVVGMGAIDDHGGRTILLANITPDEQTFALDQAPRALELLDIATAGASGFVGRESSRTIVLGAFACVRLGV